MTGINESIIVSNRIMVNDFNKHSISEPELKFKQLKFRFMFFKVLMMSFKKNETCLSLIWLEKHQRNIKRYLQMFEGDIVYIVSFFYVGLPVAVYLCMILCHNNTDI